MAMRFGSKAARDLFRREQRRTHSVTLTGAELDVALAALWNEASSLVALGKARAAAQYWRLERKLAKIRDGE